MKTKRRIKYFLSVALLLAITMVSCKKEDEVTIPDYVGDWERIEYGNAYIDGVEARETYNLSLTETTMEMDLWFSNKIGRLLVYSYRADLTEQDNNITFELNYVRIQLNGIYKKIYKNDQEWGEQLASIGLKERGTVAYSVNENSLTLNYKEFGGEREEVYKRK